MTWTLRARPLSSLFERDDHSGPLPGEEGSASIYELFSYATYFFSFLCFVAALYCIARNTCIVLRTCTREKLSMNSLFR